MGHANLSNICEFFLRRLYAKGKLSIKECTDALVAAGEKLHASECSYEDNCMLAHGLEDVIRYLLTYWENNGSRGRKDSPVIEPVELSDEQSRILTEWLAEGPGFDWDCGDDGLGGEYGILDSIQWKYCKGWRTRYKEVELLENVTH